MGNCINKVWYLYAMEYYPIIKYSPGIISSLEKKQKNLCLGGVSALWCFILSGGYSQTWALVTMSVMARKNTQVCPPENIQFYKMFIS